MASFGRRPTKSNRPGAISSSSRRSVAQSSETFLQLKKEEEDRERYAKEFEVHTENERREFENQAESQARERRETEELLKRTKDLPNPTVFLDIEVKSRSGRVEASGRLEIELFADVVPRTAENFRCLCTGEKGKDLHFKGTTFHRIVPGFMAQGGDITRGDGTGGLSIYGPCFSDESFKRLHARANLLSMANAGPNTNNSQFFILYRQSKHLDNKHVVFGEIIREDGAVVKKMEAQGSESGEVDGSVVIVNCGELKGDADQQKSMERFRHSRSRTRSKSRQRKQRRCYI